MDNNLIESAEAPAAPEKRVPAVQRAARILRHLARADGPAGVNEIARATGLVPSTCLHILRTLGEEGLVAVDPAAKRYRLGVGLLTLARDLLAHSGFAQEVAPALERLAARHDVTAIATELDGRGHMVALALAHARSSLSIHVAVGSRFPALISASGRCYAARLGLPEARLRRGFDRLRWQNPPAFADWLGEVEEAGRRGYAIDRDNYIGGITVIAALLPEQPGAPARGIAAVGLSRQLDGKLAQTVADDVRQAAISMRALP